jgi:cell division protein FtsB
MTSLQAESVAERAPTLQQIIADSGHTSDQRIMDFTRLATAVQRQRLSMGVSDAPPITRSTALWVLMQLDADIKAALTEAGVDQAELGDILSISFVPAPVMVDAAELHEYFAQAMRTYLKYLSADRPIGLTDLAAAILQAGRDDSNGLLPGRLRNLKLDFDTAITLIDNLIHRVPSEDGQTAGNEEGDGATHPGPAEQLAAPPADLPFPPDEPFLVGRDDAVESLVAALRRAAAATTDGFVVLVSGGGGKGAVVRRAAHLVSELFPDGRYWADLLTTPDEDTFGVVLAAFGIVPPAGVADRAAAYREATDGRRMLAVLENPSVWQLDACRLQAPGSATVVILSFVYPIDAAERIELGPLDRSAQIAILGSRGGAAAVDQDPAAVDRLLRLADDELSLLGVFAYVLAGGVAAADLADFAEAEFSILEELPRKHLSRAVEATIESLSADQRRIFRWLQFFPEGRTFAVEFIAESLGESLQTTDALLSRLARDGVVERLARGRFRITGETRDAAIVVAKKDPGEDFDVGPLARVWLGVLKREARRPVQVSSRRLQFASLDADVAEGGTDLLDMKRDVDALCYVLTAKDLVPPLSVGLFGDWGTGKTFFMDLMRTKIRRLSADSAKAGLGNTQLCSNVRQVVFNAWHYIDANLWASLVTHILNELARPEDATNVTEQAEQESLALLGELATSRELQKEAEGELHSIKAERKDLNKDLADVREDRQGTFQKLLSLPLADLRDNHPAEKALKQSAELLGTELGRSEDIAELKEVASDLQGLGGQIRETRRLLKRDSKLRWDWVLAITVGLAIAGALLAIVANWARIAGAIAALAFLIGAVAEYATKLKAPIEKVRKAVGTANDVLRLVGQVEPAKQRELELKIGALDAREEQLHDKIHQSVDREQRLDRQIEEIKQGRSICRYIEERARSDEYQKYLGLVALVRKDFETLALRMEESRQQAEKAAGPQAPGSAEDKGVFLSQSGKPLSRIDRVILYIDDLDRCPADRVVEVLEAVYLLLAFKLFVVVVGVDSRWLLRSLERHYAGQLAERESGFSDDEAYWMSTPQNYLEKIFQVPFSIRPMGRAGYQNLVTELLRSSTAPAPAGAGVQAAAGDTEAPVEEPPAPSEQAPEAVATSNGSPGQVPVREPPVSRDAAEELGTDSAKTGPSEPVPPPAATESPGREEPAGEASTDGDPADEQSDVKPEALLLQLSEVEYLKGLGRLVATPRAAKRLINTYRLLRVSLDDVEYSRFAPSPEGADHYMIVLILLGILVGFPTQAWPLFQSLAESKRTDWWDFWGDLRDEFDPQRQAASRQETADTLDNGQQSHPPGGAQAASDPASDDQPSGDQAADGAPPEPVDRNAPRASNESPGQESPRDPPRPPHGSGSGAPTAREQPQSAALQWRRLFEVFEELPAGADLPTSLDAFRYWAQRVSRYSFYTGRLTALADLDITLP